jgi:hypothetical protein
MVQEKLNKKFKEIATVVMVQEKLNRKFKENH